MRFKIRGLRDIRTHGSLAREGRLVSVARDMHTTRHQGGCGTADPGGWDSSVDRHIFRKGLAADHGKAIPARRSVSCRELSLSENAKLDAKKYQIGTLAQLIEEFHAGIAEGLPVALDELKRLEDRLAQLRTG